MPFVVVIGVAFVSQHLESALLWRQTSSTDAYRAALIFLKTAPDLHDAVSFSNIKDSVVERWGPTRFHVSGYVNSPKSHDSYSCVLHYNGADRWEVEDVHIERVE